MKHKNTRFAFLNTVMVAASSSLLLPSVAKAQTQYWAASVGKTGNRDGIWHPTSPVWSSIPGGPPTSPWINTGNTTAYFGGPEGGNVAVTSPMRFRAIVSDTMAPVTITGAPLTTVTSTIITVIGSPLTILSPLTGNSSPLEKRGPGLLELGGPLSTSRLTIQAGELSLSGNNLSNNAQVINRGILTMRDSDTISRYTQNGGTLAGTGTLTATSGATLESGAVSGKLLGNTVVTGNLDLSGSTGGGSLTISSGTTTLTGSSTNSLVTISKGASLVNASGKLNATEASVNNSGKLTLLTDDTIHSYNQNHSSELAGPGRLTVSKQATLNGGRISGQLTADIRSNNDAIVSGNIGGGSLSVEGGRLTLSGTSTHQTVTISLYGTLINSAGGLDSGANVINRGLLLVDHADTIANYTQISGTLGGRGMLTVTGRADVYGGRISGNLSANTVLHGDYQFVTGRLEGESLSILRGTTQVSGMLQNEKTTVSAKARLDLQKDSASWIGELVNAGDLNIQNHSELRTGRFINLGGNVQGDTAVLETDYLEFNSGFLRADIVVHRGGILNGGQILGMIRGSDPTSGEPNDAEGEIHSRGNVLVAGRIRPATDFRIQSGMLSLTGAIGTIGYNTFISEGATLRGDGKVSGSLINGGTVKILSSGDGSLQIEEDFSNTGELKLALKNAADHDLLQVGGVANLGGDLVVTNTGSGLRSGQIAQIIEAEAFQGEFEKFEAVGFDRGVLFDDATGRLIGMGGFGPGSAETYLNLNRSQTSVYLSLYEDAVEPGVRNVTTGDYSARTAAATASAPAGIQFSSGISNGDPQLVAALNLATFTHPGSIFQSVINPLSPEVHRGMADYTEQGLRSHVVEAVENAPESRYGDTQVFATAHSGMERVESSATGAGYDLDMAGVTTGIRHETDERLELGGLLGMDFGSIKGPLVDTDAQGLALGLFGRYLIDAPRKVTLTASMAYGAYDYDPTRHSFGGDANADDVSSDAFELAAGVSASVYEKAGFRVLPNATLRYLTGRVDRFTESGSGVGLRVGSQDIDSVLLDLGVDFEYQVHRQITLTGGLGYLHDFQDSDNSVSGAFAAAGAAATPFTVSAPGVEDEAFVLGLGAFYDLNERARVGLSYSGMLQTSGEYAHRFGLGASFGF